MAQRVRDYLDLINDRTFLPGLQREFVWGTSQIEGLFDSIIRGYPVGILIEWDVRTRDRNEFYSYEFIDHYIADDGRVPSTVDRKFSRYNDQAPEDAACDNLIIDGQQRLTSLYLGVTGSIATYSGGRGHSRDDPSQWERQRLCVDLFGHPEYDDEGLPGDYRFRFRRVHDFDREPKTGFRERGGTKHFWFPLPDVMNDDGTVKSKREMRNLVVERLTTTEISVSEEEFNNLRNVSTAVIDSFHDNVLAFEIPVDTVDKETNEIKEIFQRINVQGATPKPYQLLMSKMMSYWPYEENQPFNPREQVEDWLDTFKERYSEFETSIDRDLFMRYTCFVGNQELTASKVKSLDKSDMNKLRAVWLNSPESYHAHEEFEWFRRGLEKSLQTIRSLGLASNSFPSMTPVALLGKFFYENPNAEVNRENTNEIARFFALALLLNESHGVLRRTKMRSMAQHLAQHEGEYEVFPTDDLFDSKNLHPSREDIRRTVENARYTGEPGQPVFANTSVASILALLDEAYTTRATRDASEFDVDHIFPRNKRDVIEEALGAEVDLDRLGNLHLLHRTENSEEKSDILPADWLDTLSPARREEIMQVNQFPKGISLKPENYEEFVTAREEQIVDYLTEKYVR